MNNLVATLGITNLSKSQVSDMAKELDVIVEDFHTRPLDTGPYLYVSFDVLTMKVREAGRVVKTGVLLATGVNADGYREFAWHAGRHRGIGRIVDRVLPRPERPRPGSGVPGHQ